MTTTVKSLVEINATTMAQAEKSIIDMVNGRGLILTGRLDLSATLSFPSKNRQKEFKKRLERVIEHPSMKRVSMFLRMYAQLSGTEAVKIDYSPKEKQIQEYRKAYVEARKKAIEAYSRYKEEKGDFYKSIHLKG
jgi:hypothetical protein